MSNIDFEEAHKMSGLLDSQAYETEINRKRKGHDKWYTGPIVKIYELIFS